MIIHKGEEGKCMLESNHRLMEKKPKSINDEDKDNLESLEKNIINYSFSLDLIWFLIQIQI